MKKLLTIIDCALVAQSITTFAGPTYTTQEEIGREYDRRQQEAARANVEGRSLLELSYPTHRR
jgi:hypothetical protein